MTTTVVRVAKPRNYDVYIGKRVTLGGWNLPQSKWCNPYSGPIKTMTVALYEQYLLDTPELMDAIHELRGKRLGCWCIPGQGPCHGDVLARLANGISLSHGSTIGDDVKSLDK